MRTISRLILIALFAASQYAFADDLFPGGVPREIKQFSTLPSGTTLGGYALYSGGLQWRLVSHTVGSNNLDIKYGRIHLVSPKNNSYFAEMYVSTNLTQSSEEGHYTGDPCGAGSATLHAGNKSSGQRDNCMTIAPYHATVNGKELATLSISIRNTQSNWRLYNFRMLLNLEQLGFPETTASDWTQESISRDPKKKMLLDRVIPWADKLQDAVNIAIGYNKPQEAFSGVPPISSLADSSARTIIASN